QNMNGGVLIDSGATNNTIGGLTSTPGTAPGNVISGNNIIPGDSTHPYQGDGIAIVSMGTSSNWVQGNIIRLDETRTRRVDTGGNPLGNGGGVVVGEGASDNTIGGVVSGARNVISNNDVIYHNGSGIQLAGASRTLIAGNFIGTDITGTLAMGGQPYGG